MRRAALLLVVMVAALSPAAASAHPLGNFSINHLSEVSISRDHVDVRWILDQAEIPTFQERGDSTATVLARKEAEVRRALRLTVDGRVVPLQILPGAALSHPPGQGGLPLTRVILALRAAVHDPHRVALHDGTFPGRVGWKAIVPRPGAGTAVRTRTSAADPTHELTAYPKDQLSSPADIRDASFSVRPGPGTLAAPHSGADAPTTTDRSGDGFAGVFADAASGHGVLILLLFAAFAWGAIHALSPGHGKTMVAAYLVGTRGTARHAVALGAVTTVTHTIGVFALGLVTLLLAQYIVPEDLYPWLNLVSGLMVLVIGAAALRSRLRFARRHRDHHHHHHHHHDAPQELTWRGLVAMGASAGIVPCPSALVVLLGAIAQHQIALGLLLIVLFSLGLAATLTGLGLAVVFAGRVASRLPGRGGTVVAVLPTLSTVLILALGLALTVRAVPHLSM